jgi:hypothetical protein
VVNHFGVRGDCPRTRKYRDQQQREGGMHKSSSWILSVVAPFDLSCRIASVVSQNPGQKKFGITAIPANSSG